MRVLLDTHIVIWAMVGSKHLSPKARRILEDGENEFLLSSASLWEIALKHAASPDGIPVSTGLVQAYCLDSGIHQLPVTFLHAAHTETLPPIHGDPFDRMLVAQAMCEGLTLLTHDDNIVRYGKFAIRC